MQRKRHRRFGVAALLLHRSRNYNRRDPRYGVWGAVYGGNGTVNGNPTTGSHTTTSQIYGVAAGMDYALTPDTKIGFALGGAGTNWGLVRVLAGAVPTCFRRASMR